MINLKKIPENAKLFKVEIVTEVYKDAAQRARVYVMAPDAESAEREADSYDVKCNEQPTSIYAEEIKPSDKLTIDETMKGCLLYYPHRVYEDGDYGYEDMIKELRERFIREKNKLREY